MNVRTRWIAAALLTGAATAAVAQAADRPSAEGDSTVRSAPDAPSDGFKAQSDAVARENLHARQERKRQPKDGNINDAVWGTKNRKAGPEGTTNGGDRAGGSASGSAGLR